jgi:RNA polymerase sigma-B factor
MSIPDQPGAEQRAAQAAAVADRFRAWHAAPPDSAEAASLRDALIADHLPLVRAVVHRFADRGEPIDDLVQVGSLGLVKAVDRYDPEFGAAFSSFAVPTILGEVKRHFRDHTWSVRVPRRLQELRLALARTTPELQQQLGRSPTVAELAAAIGTSAEEVLEAMEAADAYQAMPLDVPAAADGLSAGDRLGELDLGIQRVEDREALRPLLAELPEREREILRMRFIDNATQSQIADAIGVSQMHVSRLLARTLEQLRESLAQPV